VVVFCKPVAVTPAVVRRDGRVQAGGHPADHARLGVIERQLDAMTGQPGVIGQVAAQVIPRGKVKGTARRSMTMAAAIRAALMPEAGCRSRRSNPAAEYSTTTRITRPGALPATHAFGIVTAAFALVALIAGATVYRATHHPAARPESTRVAPPSHGPTRHRIVS
jgi:hypothetical protein